MKNLKFLFSVFVIFAIMLNAYAQLTGEWVDENGACYRIRQVDNHVYWSMDGRPRVMNIFSGIQVGNIINGEWFDVPGGRMIGLGSLALRIESNDRMVKVDQIGNYGGNTWTRQACDNQDDLVGNYKWIYDCGEGSVTSSFTIEREYPDGSFTGRMDPNTSDPGTFSGQIINGSEFKITRKVSDSHIQTWQGTFNESTKTFTGTITNPNCTFSATKNK